MPPIGTITGAQVAWCSIWLGDERRWRNSDVDGTTISLIRPEVSTAFWDVRAMWRITGAALCILTSRCVERRAEHQPRSVLCTTFAVHVYSLPSEITMCSLFFVYRILLGYIGGGDMPGSLARADPSDHYWRDWRLFSWLLRQRILCGLINRDSW
jgi:hypothetical protein